MSLPIKFRARVALTAMLFAGAIAAPASAATVTAIHDFNVAGILSIDSQGDPLNETFSIALQPGAHVTGIGWDVELFADAPSWLSEMVVSFGPTAMPPELLLTPGVGDDFSGTESYSSGGILDLVQFGIDFNLLPDGMLEIEFFESFDDFVGDWDGVWNSGLLSIRYEYEVTDRVPEPATGWLLLTALAAGGAFSRRRHH